MCVVSMIFDHYGDKWERTFREQQRQPRRFPFPVPVSPPISPAEIEEFRQLVERAREYDREHQEPDCELAEKKQKVKDLAEQLGVAIDFV